RLHHRVCADKPRRLHREQVLGYLILSGASTCRSELARDCITALVQINRVVCIASRFWVT
ncbi:hypothetical protein, partial [Pseudomonas sp. FSL R10-0399]|uniref:hypothetical protein n=1 Tax=Pseudomonas sp. FSL R10-0399 TaxID=2662194 RepID=UPI001C49B5E7